MRKIAIITCALACCFGPAAALAQNCKADVSREDRITKEQVEIWTQVLSSTSFAASFMSTSELTITATIGRYGTLNAVGLEIQKKEESATNAAFESALRGAQGNPFYFGFKNGTPLSFVVSEVGNNAQVKQELFGAKGVTTVMLSAVVSDSDMASMRDALTSKQIDAVRIVLAGNDGIEKNVDEKNGQRLMEKFACFYQSLDARGITLSTTAKPKSQADQSASVSESGLPQPLPGQYSAPGGSRLVLFPGGQFTKFLGGGQGHGQYAANGDNLTLTMTSTGFSQHFKIQGGKLLDVNTQQVWSRTGDAPAIVPESSAASPTVPAPLPEIAPPPTIAVGQTKEQVTAAIGQPVKAAKIGAKEILYYKDMKVTLLNGKVSDVE